MKNVDFFNVVIPASKDPKTIIDKLNAALTTKKIDADDIIAIDRSSKFVTVFYKKDK